jgi:hypothetical protein
MAFADLGPIPYVAATVQKFAASGTYTLPTSPRKPLYVRVEMIGGGGGGGGSGNVGGGAGAGGGAGSYSVCILTASQIGVSQTVTIGIAGTAATAGNNAGGNGGTTSLGTLCTAPGGTGGGERRALLQFSRLVAEQAEPLEQLTLRVAEQAEELVFQRAQLEHWVALVQVLFLAEEAFKGFVLELVQSQERQQLAMELEVPGGVQCNGTTIGGGLGTIGYMTVTEYYQ